MRDLLFVSSEIYPLLKTGGLADVSASLPRALQGMGFAPKLLMPAYGAALEAARSQGLKQLQSLEVEGQTVRLWQTRLPGTKLSVWLVDLPEFSERPGNPYCTPEGHDWPDNAQRFHRFAQVAVRIALDQAGLNWRPQIVHCNDWQTGLIPALLAQQPERPATVFTIHNLAYQGLFPYHTFATLQLPHHLWHHEALEFHGQLSFMKGGLVYADQITTVSPTYAAEIQTPLGGNGLDGLLRHRQAALHGILNGIDTAAWNPGSDPFIAHTYNRRTLADKQQNKQDLQKKLGLKKSAKALLIGFIGRLVEQKGVDLILAALPELLEQGCQAAVLGSGMPHYEEALQGLAQQYPGRLAVTLGYDEALAHRIEAGADLFLMPSRFEPCGLNQMYSLRYGTLPLVRAVGGLRDTVRDPGEGAPAEANGFVFQEATPAALRDALLRALASFKNPEEWRRYQLNAMQEDHSWKRSAAEYERVYAQALALRGERSGID